MSMEDDIRAGRRDGRPAFPRQEDTYGQGSKGMSLRDYFAGQALAGYASKYGCRDDSSEALLNDARACYRIADAMLAARDYTPTTGEDHADKG